MTIAQRDQALASAGNEALDTAGSDEAATETGGYEDDSDDLTASPTLWSQGSFDAVAGRFRQARVGSAAAVGGAAGAGVGSQTGTRDASDLWASDGSTTGATATATAPGAASGSVRQSAASDAALHDTDVRDHFGNPMHGSGP